MQKYLLTGITLALLASAGILLGCATGRTTTGETVVNKVDNGGADANQGSGGEMNVLEKFKASQGAGSRFSVTEHADHYEVIVTHPSSGDQTGGAEQYFVDKKTGEAKMGWHEHPMHMPGLEEEVKVKRSN